MDQKLIALLEQNDWHNRLNEVSAKFAKIDRSLRHCEDCGVAIKEKGAVTCRSCNMRRVGKRPRKFSQ